MKVKRLYPYFYTLARQCLNYNGDVFIVDDFGDCVSLTNGTNLTQWAFFVFGPKSR